MVVISCVCGKATIRYTNQVPRVIGSCGCYDCQTRVTQQSHKELDLSCPIGIWYLDNQIQLVNGEIEFVKLYENAPMTNMFSKCCQTCLGGRRPDYHGNSIYVTPKYCGTIQDVDEATIKKMKVTFLAFPQDWPVPMEPPPYEIPQIWFNENKTGVTGSKGYLEAFQAFQMCVTAPLVDDKNDDGAAADDTNDHSKAMTMEEMMETTKATVRVLES